ncbi:MAG: tRNA uridine-5-carboxymethylaminomethyl(34) synthesis GTPase MnmE [Alloprevotella sp.]|nr:tRNA uridine-5-carboxymethylaminomethyl(34) synthesis GTPase MnmE [Alloprevotella sp.]
MSIPFVNPETTICAPATAEGGALSLIRVSGPQALSIVSSIVDKDLTLQQPNTIRFMRARDGEELIDEVLVSIFKAPASYTGEDMCEVSCHGSTYIVQKLLEVLVKNGCIMANPGEFTQRAFLNGKMDLSQAEAVADIIAASSKVAHDIAIKQLRGQLSNSLSELRSQLLKLTSLLELELDFSDHEDLEFADRDQLKQLAEEINLHISQLTESFRLGNAIKNGIPVAIIGKTNVGKSTILNRLLHDERAIVSDVHGTTRDTIEDTVQLNGVLFRIIDTAGLRETSDTVEQIGIERTYQAIHKATIVLWVIDQEPDAIERQEITSLTEDKELIIVRNKIDQSASTTSQNYIPISAKTGKNFEKLELAIYERAGISLIPEGSVIITNARHYEALQGAQQAIQKALQGIRSNLPGDLLAENLRETLHFLAEIVGEISSQDILNNIFKNFCVGK